MAAVSGDLARLTLVEAADAVAAGAASAVEVTEACLARAERLQPEINCFIGIEAEEALAAARAADAARAGGAALGPLHGLPLAHKDMFYREGKVSTCGSLIRRDFVADYTATVQERLAAAGTICLGTLNMAEFAVGPTGHNFHYGHNRNPWNPAHVTGGSSAGSGAAVAARLVHGALGSDTGGSIRLPAALCGVVGLKPTQTRVSRYGVMPLSFSLDCVGPLTRTVRDCARMTGVIAGHDPMDPTSSDRPVDDYEAACGRGVKGLRLGLPKRYSLELDGAVAAAMTASLTVFEDLGAEIVEVDLPDDTELSHLSTIVTRAEGAAVHGDWLRERRGDYSPQVLRRLEIGLAIPATRYLEALSLRAKYLDAFAAAVFDICDILHLPTVAMPAPTIEETDVGDSQALADMLLRVTGFTRPVNYLGVPSLSVPAGFSPDGLPVAFQLIGRPFHEAALFAAGHAYETVTGWHARVPEIAA